MENDGDECSFCGCDLYLNEGREWGEEGPICWCCLHEQRSLLFAACKMFAAWDENPHATELDDAAVRRAIAAAIAKAECVES